MLDEILERVNKLPEASRKELVAAAVQATQHMVWVPNPGSQMQAYESAADEVGYGGEAGPGKTALLVGLSLNLHRRSLIIRRTNKEAEKLVDEWEKTLGHRNGWNSQKHTWVLPGKVIDLGGCQNEDDKQKYKGVPHDLIGVDQVEDFTQSQYEFIIGWNRSTERSQRCRIMATMNPPTRSVGLWVLKRWGPWLDPRHPRPALSGEIRWFTTTEEGDTEMDGPGPHMIDGKPIMAKSRTFIRGYLNENPDLVGTGYEGRLAGLPKEMRSAYHGGKFEESLRDAPNQAIPTEWVRLAQQRWTSKPPHGIPMCAMGVDPSGGGEDPMAIACRYDGWFARNVKVSAKDIPMDRAGGFMSGTVVANRRDNALVVVDLGGGYGGSLYEHLKANEIDVRGYKGAEATPRRSRDGRLKFTNKRSAAYWVFREALDPGQPGGSPIALPDDPMLFADLCAPTFDPTPNGIKLESKEDVCERLGRSPDDGDAVVMAWFEGPRETTHALEWIGSPGEQGGSRSKRRPVVVMGRHNVRR